MLLNTSSNIAKISAAGSGKTYDICNDALAIVRNGKRVLITTYTNRGAESIRREIKKQNSGVLHPLVVVKTWFSFILSDLIRPYQKFLTGEINGIKAYDYTKTYGFTNFHKSYTRERYITKAGNVLSNEASALAVFLNQLSYGKVIHRIEEIYQTIFVDEIQDLAGFDIDIVKLLIDSKIGFVCCGDNKQATFKTHNAKKNKQKTGKNIWVFFKNMEDDGLVEVQKNLSSRRFNQQICAFANMIFPFGDSITSIMNDETGHDGVFLIDISNIEVYRQTFLPQILRYDIKTDTMGYNALNFGICKGETFSRVAIFPNDVLLKFILNGIPLKAPEKYYVAVTRPKYSIAFVLKDLPKSLLNYEEVQIPCGNSQVRALRFIADC